MQNRQFNTQPKLSVLGERIPVLTKEQYQLLKQGWRAHLLNEGWACPRYNLIYSLLTSNPLAEAFTPVTNERKLLSRPVKDPWYFVNSRLGILYSDANYIGTLKEHELYRAQAQIDAWWKPWKDLLPVSLLVDLGKAVGY